MFWQNLCSQKAQDHVAKLPAQCNKSTTKARGSDVESGSD